MSRVPSLALLVALLVALAPMVARAGSQDGPDGGASVTTSSSEAIVEAFRSGRFQFCHEDDYPLTPEEKDWCTLGGPDNKRACPSFREVCNNDAVARRIELPKAFTFTLPDLGLPLRVLLWVLFGVGLAVLVLVLVRHFLDHKSKEKLVGAHAAGTSPDDAAAALARQVETDVQRLLERARAEAAAGDYRAAVGDAYGALLRQLEGAGLVRVDPDQTNGDYLRKVQKDRPALAAPMAEVVRSVEVTQFGKDTPTRERFESVWGSVLHLLGGHLGPALLIAWLVLSGGACGQPRSDWDYSPSGRAGVMAYLGKRGFEVHERLIGVAKISESKSRELILLPGAHLADEEWTALKNWVESGKSLVVAGGVRPLPDWVGARIVEKTADKSELVVPAVAARPRFGAVGIRVPGANRVEPGKESRPLFTRKDGAYAVERAVNPDQSPAGRIVVLADDFLFRNVSVLTGDNAVALEKLLGDGGTSIELAGDLTGLVSSNPVESVKRGRLGPGMLQLAVFLLLFFVCKGARFGRPVDTQTLQRREFAEHVRAVGLHYARARAERHALACLGAYAVDRMRERCGVQLDRSLSGLAEAVAKRTGRPVGDVMRVLLEARDAKAGEPAEKGARDLETAWQLCKLLEETGGTGGHKRIQSHV